MIHGIRRWPAVVLIAPDKVPNGRDEHETEEHNRGVVHTFLGDFRECWHAEEWDGEETPC